MHKLWAKRETPQIHLSRVAGKTVGLREDKDANRPAVRSGA